MHRLREFELVSIGTPPGMHRLDAFDAHVIAIVGATIALEPVERDEVTWLPDRVADSFLIFNSNGSPVALKGDLFHLDAVGDLRFKVRDPIAGDNRRATRLAVCAPVQVTRPDGEQLCEALTVNLSATGVLIEGRLDAEIRGAVEVILSLPGVDAPVVFGATVARTEEQRTALELSPAAKDARLRLARFVHANKLAAFRRRRSLAATYELDF